MKKKNLMKLQEKYRKDYQMQDLIARTQKVKPYVDQELSKAMWGTDASIRKESNHEGV